MEIAIVAIAVALGAILLAVVPWRPSGRRPRTPEEAVEEAVLAAERARTIDRAKIASDRYDTRP